MSLYQMAMIWKISKLEKNLLQNISSLYIVLERVSHIDYITGKDR